MEQKYHSELARKCEELKQREQEVEEKRKQLAHDSEMRRKAELALERERVRLMQPFPPFTADEERLVSSALGPGYEGETLVSGFNVDLKRSDVRRLRPGQWLNDEIINFYMNLLLEVANCKVHFFNTFWYPLLSSGGYNRVKSWTRRVDLFTFDKVIVPIHLGNHWCLSVINLRDKQLEYYDSLNGSERCFALFREYLAAEHLAKKNAKLDMSSWKNIADRTAPQQHNGYDCGVFTCQFARCSAQDLPFDFSQENMSYLRRRMVVELLQKRITS